MICFLSMLAASEVKRLHSFGLEYSGRTHKLIQSNTAFVGDAPVRAYLQMTKGHNGHRGCGSCVGRCVAESIGHRTIYSSFVAQHSTNDWYGIF